MSTRIWIVVVALAACESSGRGTGGGSGAALGAEGSNRGSAGGFSATMSAELAKESGVVATTDAAPPAGSASDAAKAGSATEAAKVGSATAAAKVGSAATSVPAAGSAAPRQAGSAAVTTPPASTAAATKGAVGAIAAPASRTYVKPAPDIAAIKFDLEPNWERDMGEAGTFSIAVKIPNTNDTRLFSVRYGYEDQSAPVDCDQYRKFLEDRKQMKVTLNRQRGAACYLEGIDQGGVAAYRFLLTYGGKRLMCHGSLYKDSGAAALGDLRDKVLLQAKKICETLAL